ncbi:MAG: hypothetical protein IGS39_19920 [Calothrix sp. C42_A2020_038]|nr:hypothetical protein [Calothrix sp. C42_A2020_038]
MTKLLMGVQNCVPLLFLVNIIASLHVSYEREIVQTISQTTGLSLAEVEQLQQQ